jgi:hypothetical protein
VGTQANGYCRILVLVIHALPSSNADCKHWYGGKAAEAGTIHARRASSGAKEVVSAIEELVELCGFHEQPHKQEDASCAVGYINWHLD